MPAPRHFAQDERSIGGAHMIQQQFNHMRRSIRTTKGDKKVDTTPPLSGMFRRAYYARVGCDFGALIPPPTIKAKARVDTTPPASYALLKNLYINTPQRARLRKAEKRQSQWAARHGSPWALGSPLSSKRTEGPVVAHEVLTATAKDNDAVHEYRLSIMHRLDEISCERKALQRRKVLGHAPDSLRTAAQACTTPHPPHSHDPCPPVPGTPAQADPISALTPGRTFPVPRPPPRESPPVPSPHRSRPATAPVSRVRPPTRTLPGLDAFSSDDDDETTCVLDERFDSSGDEDVVPGPTGVHAMGTVPPPAPCPPMAPHPPAARELDLRGDTTRSAPHPSRPLPSLSPSPPSASSSSSSSPRAGILCEEREVRVLHNPFAVPFEDDEDRFAL